MSTSPRDVMPDKTRKALHDTAALGPSAASAAPAPLDVYRREADALLVPAMARDEAVNDADYLSCTAPVPQALCLPSENTDPSVPAMARDEAVRRVSQRMGLDLVDGSSGKHVLFRIVHSTKYNYLTLHFDHDKFTSYSLRSINGPADI